jgi:NtrC-family two-component system sensor histidine kinase KinB
MKLRSRLIAGFSAVLLLALAGLGMAALAVREVALTTDHMVEQDFSGVDVSSRLRVLMSALMMEGARRIGQPGRPLARLAEAGRGEGAALVAEARALARSPEEHAIVDRAEQGLAALLTALERADGGPPAAGIPEPVVLAFEELRAATLDLYAFNMREMRERGERVQGGARSVMLALALLAAFMVILGVLASLRLARRLAAPMERLAAAATDLSRGRFDVSVPATGLHEGDLLAQRFNEMAHAIGRFHAMNLDKIVAEQQRLDRVLANIDDGLVIFDETGRIERLNPVAAERLALDPEEALGRRLAQVADLPQLARQVDTLLTRPAAELTGERDLRTGKGEAARTLSCSLTPFSDGSKTGVVLVVRDVTEERLFERLRSEFVLRASHELRTPVTSVRMALGLLERSLAPPEGSRERELLDTVASDMNRLLQLIENLLDLSRLYARTRALERSDVAADALLRRALERFEDQARQRQVALTLDCSGGLPLLSVDCGLLDRVLDNLLGNALRNTPKGGAVRLSCRAGPGQLLIEVSDSGPGIPGARLARVFEPFVQVGGKTGGAGLGLAMCREIIEQHEGRIDVASEPGQGTRFTVRLPVQARPASS